MTMMSERDERNQMQMRNNVAINEALNTTHRSIEVSYERSKIKLLQEFFLVVHCTISCPKGINCLTFDKINMI
jgi:hypothetical protein